MALELSAEEKAVLGELDAVESIEELQALRLRLEEVLKSRVSEVMEPAEGLQRIQTEIKDLYLLLYKHREALSAGGYPEQERLLLRDSFAAFQTIQGIFDKRRTMGEFKTRRVEEVVEASKPWREKLRRKAEFAFFFNASRRAAYADHNATGTLEEEIEDLRALTTAVEQDREELVRVGLTEEEIAHGQQLLTEALGRDVLAVVGIRNQAAAKLERDRLLTLTIILARYGRAAGTSAFTDAPEHLALFQRVSFRNALRRIKRTRTSAPSPESPPSQEDLP
ncbi:MAG: hypothetical protein AAFX99_28620 [Myxococcota bacterium]